MAQRRNAQMEELLSAHMARRDEPNFALGNAISSYLALPVLRGFWPTSANHISTQYYFLDDISSDYDVTGYSSVKLGYSNLFPWTYLGGSQYWTYADDAQFDINGIDAYTSASLRGLTCGAWVRIDSEPGVGVTKPLIVKSDGTNGYGLGFVGAGGGVTHPAFAASLAGATDGVVSTVDIDDDIWYFIVGRWNTSTVDVWVDGVKTSVASANASVGLNAQPLYFGYAGGAVYWDGYMSMIFICASSVSDSIIKNLYQQTRYMFGKN